MSSFQTFMICGVAALSTLIGNLPGHAQEPAQVVVVATQHFITDLPEGYSPGHLRAILNRIEPDLVAAEAPKNLVDPWSHAPAEIAMVVKPWAADANVEIVPIGWNEPNYGDQVNQMIQQLQAKAKAAEFQQIEVRFQQSRGQFPPTCQHLNSDGHHQVWREYHRDLHDLFEKETPWENWNNEILGNVIKTCKENPGKRIAIVIGAAHAYFLIDGLAEEPAAKVSRIDQFLPLPEAEARSATKPVDYLRALRPLNLELIPPAELERIKPFLDQLKDNEEFRGDYQLFLGKFLLHQKKPKEALKEFEVLGQLDREAQSKFDDRTKLFETGLIYSALALFQSGDRDTAVRRLENAVRDQELQVETRNWAQQVLQLIK